MAWIVFRGKRQRQQPNLPFVTLFPTGKLGLSVAIAEKWLKDAQFVVLAYDPERHVIGIRPAEKTEEGAYRIVRTGTRNSGLYIGGIAFLKHFNILPEERIRRPARKEGEWIVVDLNKKSGAETAKEHQEEIPF